MSLTAIRAFLTYRYTLGQSAALLIPALAVLFAVHFAAITLGVAQPVGAAASLTLAVATAMGGGAVINRRTQH